MVELPEELLSLIVNALEVEGDKETLSNLALVNHQFLDLVNEKRCLEVTIGNKGGDVSVYLLELHRLVDCDPTFGRCIKSLTLIDNTYNYEETGDFGWLTKTRCLLNVLPDFSALKRICVVRKPGVDDAVVDWGLINESVKQGLKDLFSLSSLEELELEGVINMELEPLMGCKNLKRLRLLDVALDRAEVPAGERKEDGESTQLDVEEGTLEYLEVGNCGPALDQLLDWLECEGAPFTLSSLKGLKLHSQGYSPQMKEVIKEIIEASGDSIEELHITGALDLVINHVELSAFDILTFHKFPRLRVVDIEVELNYPIMLPQILIDLILRTLRLKADDTLETLRLTFIFRAGSWYKLDDSDRWRLSNSILDISLWSEMDTLASLGRMKTGVEIEFRGHRPLKETPGLANLVDTVYRRMPILKKRDLLEIYW